MKKWMYIIFPGAMLGLFLVLYFASMKKTAEREHAHEVEAKRIADEKAEQKRKLDERARKDAEERAAKRAADEAAKEAKKKAESEKIDREIREATNKANAEAAEHNKKIAELTRELEALRAQREKLSGDVLELAKAVERAKIDHHNAEFQVQRMAEMLARRAAESSIIKGIVQPKPSSS
jgi:hypothetical protein